MPQRQRHPEHFKHERAVNAAFCCHTSLTKACPASHKAKTDPSLSRAVLFPLTTIATKPTG